MATLNERPETIFPPSSYPTTPSPTFLDDSCSFPEPETLGPIEDDLQYAEDCFALQESSHVTRSSYSETGLFTSIDDATYRGVVESPPAPVHAIPLSSQPDFYKNFGADVLGSGAAAPRHEDGWHAKTAGIASIHDTLGQPASTKSVGLGSTSDILTPSFIEPRSLGSKFAPASRPISQSASLDARLDQIASSISLDALQPAPRFLERYTSFQTTAKPSTALRTLFESLRRRNADVSFNPSRSRLDGVVYPLNICCQFKVKMYKGSGKDDIYIEFQRRSGDCIAFSGFFKSIISDIASLKPKPLVPSLSCFPEPQASETASVLLDGGSGTTFTESKGASQDTLKALFSMATSKFQDVRLNAVEALASISEKNSCSLVAYNPDGSTDDKTPFVLLLKSLLESENPAILRATSVLLWNGFRHEDNRNCMKKECLGCQAGKLGLLDILFDIVDAPHNVYLSDVRRKITCALAVFVATHPKTLKQDRPRQKRYKMVMRRLREECWSCSTLKEACDSTIQAIDCCN